MTVPDFPQPVRPMSFPRSFLAKAEAEKISLA
jgi:hypothetical protein